MAIRVRRRMNVRQLRVRRGVLVFVGGRLREIDWLGVFAYRCSLRVQLRGLLQETVVELE
jgi:hypothetical protein